MEIRWKGHSCFEIKNKNSTIVVDPYGDIGLGNLKVKANVVLVTHEHSDHNNISAVVPVSEESKLLVIKGPGEYEVGGVMIDGIMLPHDDKGGEERGFVTAYTIHSEEITICHLGDVGAPLTTEQIDALDGVDILLIPVGGGPTVDAEAAVKIVNQIEPRIVIPMHYDEPGLKHKFDDISKFIKEIGLVPQEQETLKTTKSGLPAEEMQLVVLKKQ